MDKVNDTRNVLDKYKGWTLDSIRSDLDSRRLSVEIAVENLTRDFNMGTIVRTANAFNVKRLHIIGRRQWNKRGAMMTDKYLHVEYHDSVEAFQGAVKGYQVIAIDNVPESVELSYSELPPHDTVLVFGGESDGLSDELLAVSQQVVAIEQFGSTRSLNVGVAAGIVMYEWVRRNVLMSDKP